MLAQSIFPVLVIFLTLLIVGTLLYGIWYIYENKKQINQNWPQYKCKPYVFPFAGWFIGPPDTNPMNNFRECSWLIFKSFFDILIAPFVKILSIIVTILTNFTKDIQNIRKMVSYMRNSIRHIATDIYSKLKDTYYRLAYVYKSFMRVFHNIFKTMQASFNALLYSFYSLASIWNGPIGGTARFFCFDEDTLIKMADGSYQKIKNIQLGDKIYGGEVLATYKLDVDPKAMYFIFDEKDVTKKVIVSGSHLILEDNEWIRVENSKMAQPYERIIHNPYSKKCIYSLRTSSSLIYTNLEKIIFRDYDEINDGKINYTIFQNQIDYLNKDNHNDKIKDYSHFYFSKCKNNLYKPYFDANSIIDMKKYKRKKIKDIAIGDDTLSCGKVIGISKLLVKNTPIYQYKLNIDNLPDIYCTEGTIVKNILDNRWNKISDNQFTNPILNYTPQVMYSILTESGHIIINHIIFQDHDNNHRIQDIVDKYIIDHIK